MSWWARRRGPPRRIPWECLASTWWAHQDLNLEPTDYESAALTVELWARAFELYRLEAPGREPRFTVGVFAGAQGIPGQKLAELVLRPRVPAPDAGGRAEG